MNKTIFNKNPLFYKQTRHFPGADIIAIAFSSKILIPIVVTSIGVGTMYYYLRDNKNNNQFTMNYDSTLDYQVIRHEIQNALYHPSYDDGTCAPLLLRLAFNQAATYSQYDGLGGTNGATLRFEPESKFDHNRGLDKAMKILEPIKQKFPLISYSDLWVLASYVAIEEMGGPSLEFTGGRTDAKDGSECLPPERFPEWDQGATRLLDWFDRLGLSDREGVALLGAHSCGRLHSENSGLEGSWTNSSILSNEYYKKIKHQFYLYDKRGIEHYFDPSNPEIVLLPIEGAFQYCARIARWGEYYSYADIDVWLQDFGITFKKITEFGCHFENNNDKIENKDNTKTSVPPQM